MKNVAGKILKVMEDVTGVAKTADIGQYKAVEHDGVTKAIRESMKEHKLIAVSSTIDKEVTMINSNFRADIMVLVTYVDVESGENIGVQMPAYALDRGDKAMGKAISMAVKYAHLKTFMLESFDNEEARDIEPKLIFTAEKATAEQVDELMAIFETNYMNGLEGAKKPTDATKDALSKLTKVQINGLIEKNKVV